MKQKFKLIGILSMLLIILVTFNHCIVQSPKKNRKNSTFENQNEKNNTNITPTTYTDPTETIINPEKFPVDNNQDNIPDDTGGDPTLVTNPTALKEINMGIKNYEQIHFTMAALTGVSATKNEVKDVYNDIKTQLPSDNNLKSFVSSNQVGITKLASEYCHHLVEDSSLRQRVWPTINFSRSPAQEFNNTNRDIMITEILKKFWGSSIDMGVRDLAFLELQSLFIDLLVGEDLNSSTTTKNITKGICIATLSSANITLL